MARFNQAQDTVDPHARGDHRDYEFNLDWSKRFITKVEPGLPRGIRVQITSSHHLPSSLLMISWTPPRHAPIGNFAVPVFMHVPHSEFTKKVQSVFDQHVKMGNDYIAKHPEAEVQIA